MSQPVNPYEPPREITERIGTKSGDTHGSVVIPYSGKLSVQDYNEALHLLKKRHKYSGWGDRFIAVVSLVFLSGLCVYSISILDIRSLSPIMILPWVFLLLATVMFVLVPWWSRRRLSKQWARGKGLFALVEGQVDWQSFHVKTEHISSTVHWTNFCGYRCTERIVILFEDFPNTILIYSRNRFEKDDWEAFLQLVAEKLPAV